MNDTTVAPAAADASAHPSQVIVGSEGHESGRVDHSSSDQKPAEPEKRLSARDAIGKAIDDTAAAVKAKAEAAAKDAEKQASDAEAATKAGDVEKPGQKQRAGDGKFAKAEDGDGDKGEPVKAASGRDGADSRQSEGRPHSEPPARFLPEARSKWANVPNEVKAEFHRVTQEFEGEIQRHKEASDRYERIREFDDVARRNGRELPDTLAKIMQVEQQIMRNPIAGLDAILSEIGPRKSDGSPLTLMEVARHIVENPEAYQNASRQAMQPQQPQADPQIKSEVETLRSELHMMKAEQTLTPLINEFAAHHPDFPELQGRIVEILKSRVIENLYGNGLTLEQKLSEAYRMAGGQSPSRSEPETPPAHSAAPAARPVDPDGQKSVRGAPSGVKTDTTQRRFKSNREALEKAFSEVR